MSTDLSRNSRGSSTIVRHGNLDPAEMLICGIIEQAIFDYRDLIKYGKYEKGNRNTTGVFSREEIISFFTGKWGGWLLESVNLNISGSTILGTIERQERRVRNDIFR